MEDIVGPDLIFGLDETSLNGWRPIREGKKKESENRIQQPKKPTGQKIAFCRLEITPVEQLHIAARFVQHKQALKSECTEVIRDGIFIEKLRMPGDKQ